MNDVMFRKIIKNFMCFIILQVNRRSIFIKSYGLTIR